MTDPLQTLIDKEAIRELAMLYARGMDRQDVSLLKTLYTDDGWDAHGPYFDGPADKYVEFLAASLPHMHVGAHFICNHLISVDGDTGEGEVYAIAWHLIPDGAGRQKHDFQAVRYIDNYRRDGGQWKFARRDVRFDMKIELPADNHGSKPDPEKDLSYSAISSLLFARGSRR
jgi:ketosteroid isomerase-like protein